MKLKKKSSGGVLIFAYYSFKDPVFQSAVLPYLKRLSLENKKIVLLTWEQRQYSLGMPEIKSIEKELRDGNIIWHRTTWHSGKFKLIKKAFDFTWGIWLSFKLIFHYNVSIIYTEGFPGAVIGHCLSLLSGKKHIIHTFEPHADYMLDSGVWKESSWEYKLLKRFEIPIANQASAIITATEAYKDILKKRGVKSHILVIPSCIDLGFYNYKLSAREEIRNSLAISVDTLVIVYLGKLGGMYMDEEIFSFWKSCLDYDRDRFFFFLFTNAEAKEVEYWCEKYQIPAEKILYAYLKKNEIPTYLSAADIGYCGVRSIPSQRYSSPIKNGEYWACGLPIIIPEGISDDYQQVVECSVGYLLPRVHDRLISKLLIDSKIILNGLCREKVRCHAKKFRSLDPACKLIQNLLVSHF